MEFGSSIFLPPVVVQHSVFILMFPWSIRIISESSNSWISLMFLNFLKPICVMWSTYLLSKNWRVNDFFCLYILYMVWVLVHQTTSSQKTQHPSFLLTYCQRGYFHQFSLHHQIFLQKKSFILKISVISTPLILLSVSKHLVSISRAVL